MRRMALRNSLALTLALTLCGCAGEDPAAGGSGSEEPLSLLVIGLDTVRADRLGCYGHESAETPTIDAVAAEGVLFRNVLAHAPLTLPTHASLFTGAFPPEHGIRDNGRTALPGSLTTMAEIYREAGFRTGAFIASVALVSRAVPPTLNCG